MDFMVEEKVRFFADSLRSRLKGNLMRVILYGSRARGDFWEGSDYDFIVIVAKKDAAVEELVSETGVDFLNKYDELAAEILFDEQEWERQKRFPLGINVEREGISV